MNTQQTEEIAEKLYNQTMRDIEYGDTRDNPQWKEAVRQGFMAYATEALTRQREEIVKEIMMMKIYDSDDTSRSVINMHGYNDAIDDLIRKLKV